MADIDYIDKHFKQQDNVCALASYGTVLHYFSEGEISVDNLLLRYSRRFKIKPTASTGSNLKALQKSICEHFHGYCNPKQMRGFEYIKQLHEQDEIKTKEYCQIVAAKASLESISQADIDLIRRELENSDSLAIILYKVNETLYHAVTIGYDSVTGKYFFKDPERNSITIEDLLNNNLITEYILFRANGEL
mgnify:FL=1